MGITLRGADLEADREAIIALLARHLNPAYDRRRFDWLYAKNPAGQGRLWVIADLASGAVVGTAGACPRRLYAGGREVTGWVLADFCVAPDRRALGPAVALQRACLDALADEIPSIWYDFPGSSMLAVYARLGIEPADSMRRMVKLLRIDRHAMRRLGLLARPVRALVNQLLSLRGRSAGRTAGITCAPLATACDGEFSALAQATGDAHGTCVCRSAAYLNWRYLDNPIEPHEMVVARRAGDLVGYCVLVRRGVVITVVDLFSSASVDAVPALLAHVTALARSRGAAAINVFVLDSHPWAPGLRRLGYTPREASAVITSTLPPGSVPPGRTRPPWFLTLGDADS